MRRMLINVLRLWLTDVPILESYGRYVLGLIVVSIVRLFVIGVVLTTFYFSARHLPKEATGRISLWIATFTMINIMLEMLNVVQKHRRARLALETRAEFEREEARRANDAMAEFRFEKVAAILGNS